MIKLCAPSIEEEAKLQHRKATNTVKSYDQEAKLQVNDITQHESPAQENNQRCDIIGSRSEATKLQVNDITQHESPE